MLSIILLVGTVPSSGALGSSGVGIDVGNGGLPPEWGIRLLLWNAMFHYGPWTDRQRYACISLFNGDTNVLREIHPLDLQSMITSIRARIAITSRHLICNLGMSA